MMSRDPAMAQNTFGDKPAQPDYQQQPAQNYPQQPNYPPPDGSGDYPKPAPPRQPGGNTHGPNLDQMMQIERQDFGVAPTKQLYAGQMHSPTPASIPGAQVITTKGLMGLV